MSIGEVASANPIFNGADPHAVIIGDEYWIYPTVSGTREMVFKAYSSPDLRNWKEHATILNFKDIPWTTDNGKRRRSPWAPALLAKDGRFYFYYSVGPQNKDMPSMIGVAVGDRPDGEFKDSGRPLVTGGRGFEAIDPMAYTDAASAKTYLYAGGSDGATLRVWELGDDLISLKREVEVKTPKNFTEGAFVHERDGIYYLSYSHGRYNDASYSVHYATSESPEGPWAYRGAILQSDATRKGPGHHSFLRNPKSDQWFIVYHRYDTQQQSGTLKGPRKIAIERVEYGDDGAIKPITMTDGPPPLSPLR